MGRRWLLMSAMVAAVAAVPLAMSLRPSAAMAAPEAGGPPAGYALTPSFDEEFDGGKPSREWGHVFDDPGQSSYPITKRLLWSNAERQVYFDSKYLKLGIDPFSVHDGMMTITAAPMSAATRAAVMADLGRIPQYSGNAALRNVAYTSGLLTQRGRFVQQYGYFEVRARWTAGKGIWPAFWLLRQDSHWPPEIDIMEAIGKKPYEVYSSIHSAYPPKDKTDVVPLAGADPQKFHSYGALWLPDRIDYYVDGVKTASLPATPDMNQPMYMLVNLAIGGNWPGDPDAGTVMPAKMDIDYVRAWKFMGTPPGVAVTG